MKKSSVLTVGLILWSTMGWAQEENTPARLPRDITKVIGAAESTPRVEGAVKPQIADHDISPFWNWMQNQKSHQTSGLMAPPRIEFPDFAALSKQQGEAPMSGIDLVQLPSIQAVRDANAAQKVGQVLSLEKEYQRYESQVGFQIPVRNDPELLKLIGDPAR